MRTNVDELDGLVVAETRVKKVEMSELLGRLSATIKRTSALSAGNEYFDFHPFF